MNAQTKHNIISAIKNDLSDRFRVIDNTGQDKRIIASQFPDVLLMRQIPPENDDILFVMKIEGGDYDLINSVSSWKEFDRSQFSFYIVVPKEKLDEAKRLADLVEVFAKFAYYTLDHNGKAKVQYE